jgi:DNA polymerase III subunit gamma/tau
MPNGPSRTALARTWRPRRFAEMATQEHVSETLRAAVARGRTAHAYLFCGPRGVGKTTAARVLAMALNCPDRTAEGEPCAECESCQKIWAGRTSLDVVEIDAASNRGVDDARDLRERAMYAPTEEHRYKVYIIDEAHMLTREAWNALLKILEEPPPRVIFVFATTEPQKIQQTAAPILSRCQRFDFRRITTQGIVARLRTVLHGEGIEADDDALVPIARRAEGGMRDALSLMDQVLSFAEGRVTGDDVRRVLGLVGEELYLEMFDIIAERRYADVFRFVQRTIDEGYDLTEFYRGLADALRALMIARLEGAAAADVREDLRDDYARVAARFGHGDLLRMLSMVAELDTEGKFRKSANPRTMLEALLLRWAFLEQTIDLETLLRAAGGEAPPPLAGRPAEGGRGAGSGRGAGAGAATESGRAAGERAAAESGRAADAGAATGSGRVAESGRAADAADGIGAAGPRRAAGLAQALADAAAEAEAAGRTGRSSRPAPQPDPAPGPVPASKPQDDAPKPRRAPPQPSAPTEDPAAPAGAGVSAMPASPATGQAGDITQSPAAKQAAVIDTGNPGRDAEQAFRAMLQQGRAPHGLGIFLKAAHVAEADRDSVLLEVPAGPGLERLSGESAARREVEQVLSSLLGRPIALSVRSVAPVQHHVGPAEPPQRITPERVRLEKLARISGSDKGLKQAVEHWDLELLD